VLTEPTLVTARVRQGGEWSGLIEAQFVVGESELLDGLAVTELNYNPYAPTEEELAINPNWDNNEFEFVELANHGDQTLSLEGARFNNGIDFQFSDAMTDRPILITEAGTADIDYVEIQNVSGQAVDTIGWVVAVNDAEDDNINHVLSTYWALPGTIAAGAVLYRSDSQSEDPNNYWGDDVFWRTSGRGWVMIVDATGQVADFVVWGYNAAELAGLNVNIGGFQITAAAVWDGAPVVAAGLSSNSLQRIGGVDNDGAADWQFVAPPSKGTANTGITTPFTAGLVELAPGEYAVIARNAAAVRARYGSQIDVLGQYDGRLSNGGERLRLVDRFDRVVLDFEYGDGGAWPGRADGKGASLELDDPAGMPLDAVERAAYLETPGNWHSSTAYERPVRPRWRPWASSSTRSSPTPTCPRWTPSSCTTRPTRRSTWAAGISATTGSRTRSTASPRACRSRPRSPRAATWCSTRTTSTRSCRSVARCPSPWTPPMATTCG
jgi:hypothetical protein